MINFDGSYLYTLGHALHGVQEIRIYPDAEEPLHTRQQCLRYLYPAYFALDEFTNRSVFRFRKLHLAASEFKAHLEEAIQHCRTEVVNEPCPPTPIMFELQEKHSEFEAVLKSELATADLFLVQPKAAFDTHMLIHAGEVAFPQDAQTKVPECVYDLAQAMRCIAFELHTAAAFHLHRANETIVGAYWDAITNGKDRPKNQTLGSYIGALEKEKGASVEVLASLRDIKNLHRNPTIHADESLSDSDEAINLYGAIRSFLYSMLQCIPEEANARE